MLISHDIAIIGAGPAGSALARLIGNQFKVLLIEKRRLDNTAFSDKNGKCCGGLLAPDAQAVLARLGLGLPNHVLADPQIFAVRAIDFNGKNERFYQRHYINTDRAKFDMWMASQIPRPVDARWGFSCTGFSREKEGYKIRITDGTRSFTEQAKVMVSAEGALSALRKNILRGSDPIPKYVAIQERFKTQRQYPYFSAIFDSRITDFYAWTIPKDEFVLFGAALKPGAQATRQFEELRNRLVSLGLLEGEQCKREGTLIFRPTSPAHILTHSDDIAFIGEAAGWISPSSAEGLSWAMESAIALARSLEQGLTGFGRRYRIQTAPIRKRIMFKNLKTPFMYNALLRNAIMRSGFQSLELTAECRLSF